MPDKRISGLRCTSRQPTGALIEVGVDVNAWAEQKWTPLHLASQNGHGKAAQALIKARAEVDARQRDQWTPLHVAAQNGHTDVVAALIGAGAQIDAREKAQWTPLHLAAQNGHVEITRALIEAGSFNCVSPSPPHLGACPHKLDGLNYGGITI